MPFLFLLLLAALCLLQGGDSSRVRQEQLWRYRNLGKAYYENPTTHKEAAEEFRKALELAPDSAREHLNYGLALLRANQLNEGVAELESVQRAHPEIPHTWFNLGVVYKKRGEYQRALDQFHQMVRLVPDEPISHYNLGAIYRFLDRTDEALREFEISANLDANFVAPRFQIFNIYREAGREQETRQAFARFQALKKQHDSSGADAEDTNWSFYAEVYEPPEKPPAEAPAPRASIRWDDRPLPILADPETAGLAVFDFDGDGRPDLLLWSTHGIRLFRAGLDPVDAGLASLTDVVSVAPGDFNNDGLPDLCVLTKTGASSIKTARASSRNSTPPFPPVPSAKPSGSTTITTTTRISF